MAYAYRLCRKCKAKFKPYAGRPSQTSALCGECRRLAELGPATNPLKSGEEELFLPPMKQAVFDLETFSLDRGWGVLMMGVILVHGDGNKPKWHIFDLTESSGWPNTRSNDEELARKIINVLNDVHIVYAHNGLDFDVKWLRTIALKYGIPFPEKKLVDPVQIARRNYRIGSNSLESVADFLELGEKKFKIGPMVWKGALLDNDPKMWALLRERCMSDVRLLNEVASRVVGDAGMIDNMGSAWKK